MFDITKRVNISGCTMRELVQELSKLPEDAKVSCCGDNYVFLHIEKDGSAVCIDCEDLEELYTEDADLDQETFWENR